MNDYPTKRVQEIKIVTVQSRLSMINMVAILTRLDVWFSVTPMGNDIWEIATKAEEF